MTSSLPSEPPVAEPDWLDLREPADRRARSTALARELAAALRPGPVRILDVGCGSGATTRWLAPLLPGPQEWLLLDRDPALLALVPDRTADVRDRDGAPAACSTRRAEITALTARDLATASAVTASALVDVLTADEVDGLAATCAAARVPALLTLTVTGRVEVDPLGSDRRARSPRRSTPTSAAPSRGGGCSDRMPLPRPQTPSGDMA